MKAVTKDLIRARAYEIWEQSGRPLGLDKQHWEQAESELLDAAPAIKVRASAKSAVAGPSSIAGVSGTQATGQQVAKAGSRQVPGQRQAPGEVSRAR